MSVRRPERDATWREAPPMGSVLRCVEGPPVGGDTIWVNMVQAYAMLPEDVKKKIAFEENSNCERMRLVESRKTVGRHCFAWRKQHVKKKSAAVRKTNGVAKSCNGSRTRPASSWISNAWLGLRTNVVVNNKRLRHARLEKQKIGSVSNG